MGLEVWVAVLAVMSVSLFGVVFVSRLTKDFFERNLDSFISFSAGVFMVTAGALTLEVFAISSNVLIGILIIFIGYFLASMLNRILPETHHHHGSECLSPNNSAKKLIVGDGIHNVADGIVLITAFSTSTTLGVAITISIIVHEVLQEVSEFFVLRQAGYKTKQALLINFGVSGTIIIGVVLGYFALASKELELILLAISAGFFIHVLVHDLLPKHTDHKNKVDFIKHILLVITGVILMIAVTYFLN